MIGIDPRWLALADDYRGRVYAHSPSPRIDQTPESRAVHEAAHAVLLELTGRRVNAATIDARRADGAAGRVWAGDFAPGKSLPLTLACLEVPVFPESKALVMVWAAALYAGRQAECLRAGVAVEWLDESARDDEEARFLLSTAFGVIRGSHPVGGAQHLARLMLRQHWREVEAVAALLLSRQTVDGDSIRAAMKSEPSFDRSRAAADARRSGLPTRNSFDRATFGTSLAMEHC